jgi:hypothetical protein
VKADMGGLATTAGIARSHRPVTGHVSRRHQDQYDRQNHENS